jgi:hypothetical protein
MIVFLETIFVISGAMLMVLTLAKLWEIRRRKQVLVLALISRGDERVRHLSHDITQTYSVWRSKAEFFLNKQLPLHTKNFIQKTNAAVKENVTKYTGDIRGSRFLRKSEGLSEFFQNLAEKEEGRIDETLDTASENRVE